MNTPAPDPSAPTLPTREGYDRWSAVYDGDGNPLVALEEPVVADLLGDVRGLRIADIGCGTGRHALRLAAAGAEVSAMDFSEGMLARARAKETGAGGPGGISWIVHDLSRTLPLESGAFDVVLCALVLDHVREPGPLFGEMARVVRPGGKGRVVVSVMHPAMMLRGVQARFSDPSTGGAVRVESAANQISDYVLAGVGAGLRMVHMQEHAGDAALAAKVPRMGRYIGWPLLLTMMLER